MGFIKLDRALDNWRYKQSPNYVALWVHILLKANYQDGYWKNILVKRGSFVSSVDKLHNETGLTTRQVRTILANLKDQELTIETTNKYTLITVNKYNYYQGQEYENDKENDKQATNKRQTNDKQTTTSKEIKNIRNKELKEESIKLKVKNKEINKQIKEKNKINLGEYKNVYLTDDEVQKLINTYGRIETDLYIKFLDEYIEEKGYKSKSHYLAIKRWVINAVKEKEIKNQKLDNNKPIETIPTYDDSSNPILDTRRLEEIKRKRQQLDIDTMPKDEYYKADY